MTSATSAAPGTDADEPSPERAPVPRWPTRRLVWVLVVAGLAVWLVGGVVQLVLLPGRAATAQSELLAFRDDLTQGDTHAAADHLRAAKAALAGAEGAASFGPVRVARHLPVIGHTVADLDHLLAAADLMTSSGGDVMTIVTTFTGDKAALFDHDTVDLDAVRQARDSAAVIGDKVRRAREELQQVQGRGPKGEVALEKKQSALAQVTKLQADIVALRPVLNAVPAALGANGSKTYLVAVMNPAEMRASGGAPLSVAFVKFTDGTMTIPLKGTTSDLTGINQKTYFDKAPNDPWQVPGVPQRFVNTNFNPSFPMSADQMIRAAPSNFGIKPDGVIALDIVAAQKLLEATGPIKTADGSLTADNIVAQLLVNGYQEAPTQDNINARHDENEQLMSVMLSRLTEGGGMVGKVKALGNAVPGRHLQMYFRDARLQHLITTTHLGGAVPAPASGNLSAVYTQNTNQSKMDVFQRRRVTETVQMRADGSAVVHRTIEITNDSPPFLGTAPDEHIGYLTRWAGSQVINLMPPGARITSEPSDKDAGSLVEKDSVSSGIDQDGRTYAQARVLLPPGATTQVSWTYVVDHAAVQHGNGLRLLDFIAPQSMLTPPALDLTVIPPPGWSAQVPPGWTQSSTSVTTSTTMDQSQEVTVDVVPN